MGFSKSKWFAALLALLSVSSCVKIAPFAASREQACAIAADPSYELRLGQVCLPDGGARCVPTYNGLPVRCDDLQGGGQHICNPLGRVRDVPAPCIVGAGTCEPFDSCRWYPVQCFGDRECLSHACMHGPPCGEDLADPAPFIGEWETQWPDGQEVKTVRLFFQADGSLDFIGRIERAGCLVHEERVAGSIVTENGRMQMQWSVPQNTCVVRADTCASQPGRTCSLFMSYAQRPLRFGMNIGCPSGTQDPRSCFWSSLIIEDRRFERITRPADGGAASDASATD